MEGLSPVKEMVGQVLGFLPSLLGALVIFFLIFVGIVLYVVLRRRGAWEHERHLPLDHDEPVDALEDKDR